MTQAPPCRRQRQRQPWIPSASRGSLPTADHAHSPFLSSSPQPHGCNNRCRPGTHTRRHTSIQPPRPVLSTPNQHPQTIHRQTPPPPPPTTTAHAQAHHHRHSRSTPVPSRPRAHRDREAVTGVAPPGCVSVRAAPRLGSLQHSPRLPHLRPPIPPPARQQPSDHAIRNDV